MFQGKKVLFVKDAAIKHATFLVADSSDATLLYVDGDRRVPIHVPLESVFTHDRDAVSAFVRTYGMFPFNNEVPLTFEIVVDAAAVQTAPSLVG